MNYVFTPEQTTEAKIKAFKSLIFVRDNGCWDMVKAIDRNGYHRVSIKRGTHRGAHRYSYQIFKGTENLEKLLVLHKCNNRYCVNPEHLYLGTTQDNTNDMYRTNSHKRNNCVNIEKVPVIKQEYKDGKGSQRDLAEKYGLSQHAICDIVNGKTWTKYLSLEVQGA